MPSGFLILKNVSTCYAQNSFQTRFPRAYTSLPDRHLKAPLLCSGKSWSRSHGDPLGFPLPPRGSWGTDSCPKGPAPDLPGPGSPPSGRDDTRQNGVQVHGGQGGRFYQGFFFPRGRGRRGLRPGVSHLFGPGRISCFNNSGVPGNCFPSYETSEKVLLSGAERSCKYVVCVLFHVFLSPASIQKLLRVPLGASTVLGSEVTLPSPPQPFLQMSPGWRKALRGAHYLSPLGFARCLARADGSPNSEIIASL